MKSAGQFRQKTKNKIWNFKELAVFILKMTGAFALGARKYLPFFRLMKYNVSNKTEFVNEQITTAQLSRI